MTGYTASFFCADDCDFALSEMKAQMKVSNSVIVSLYGKSGGDLPINYPDTPIAGYNSADWLTGKEHITEGSNVNYSYNEIADRKGVRLSFVVADKNRKKAGNILLKYKAFDIKCGL